MESSATKSHNIESLATNNSTCGELSYKQVTLATNKSPSKGFSYKKITLWRVQLQTNHPGENSATKKSDTQKSQVEKKSEIQGGSQEVTVVVRRLMAKFLLKTIQVNLVLYPSETWRRQHKFT